MTAPAGPTLSRERPFPGIRPYAYPDHPFFFGRREQTSALYRLLDRSRFVSVVGDSGCGKSSLVHAGLLPTLEQETVEAGGRVWRCLVMRPGNAPITGLAEALMGLSDAADEAAWLDVRARVEFDLRLSSLGIADALRRVVPHSSSATVLLVVDQFEELFRYARSFVGTRVRNPALGSAFREEAAHFVQLLLEAARDEALGFQVLLTLRSDFIGDCARFRGLPEVVSASQFLVPSLSRHQREEIICKPLEKAGASIAPELVEQLLNEGAEDEADLLPVLQHCLARLWEAAGLSAGSGEGHARAISSPGARRICRKHYQDIGTMARALSLHADEVMSTLPGLGLVVQQVFRALSEIDKEGRAARRVVPFAQLVEETGQDEREVRDVINRFRRDDCSFLSPSLSVVPVLAAGDPVDVGHEALLRRWERVSAQPDAIAEGRHRQIGWLWIEESDARKYQGLLGLSDTRDDLTARALPPDQTVSLWNWWTVPPHTPQWAERYGGSHDRVQQLFQNSLAMVRRRDQEEARRKEAIAQGVSARAQEVADEEFQAQVAATQKARAMTAMFGLIACIAVAIAVIALL